MLQIDEDGMIKSLSSEKTTINTTADLNQVNILCNIRQPDCMAGNLAYGTVGAQFSTLFRWARTKLFTAPGS